MFERLQQMDRRTKIGLAVAAGVGLLLFATIAGVIRQAGWNEGFLFGLMAGRGNELEHVAPYLGQRGFYGPHAWGGHGFGFIGAFFRFAFFAFFVMLIFKMMGLFFWRRHHGWHPYGYGPQAGPWGQPPVTPSNPTTGPSAGSETPSGGPAEPQQPQQPTGSAQ